MSVASGEGRPLVPCSSSSSSSAQGKEEKHVVIYYPGYTSEGRKKGILVCVPVDNLIHPPKTPPSEASITKFVQVLPCSEGESFNLYMSSICTTTVGGKRRGPGPGLYFFGGLDTSATCSGELLERYVVKKVYRYDLHKFPAKETGSIIPCNDMIYGMSRPLLAQVGDDCIYVLGYGKTSTTLEGDDNGLVKLKPAFQKYNFKKDEWTLLNDNLFDINKCDCDKWVRNDLGRVPHVVIGRKLHVSIGNSSFTFDTGKGAWEDCKLFETFWTSDKTKKSGLSPLHFYGREVWNGAKRRKTEACQFGGGPPFGFSGRGILWDKNILLGVHSAPNCPLVAFLLDDETGRVVKSQQISLDNLLPNAWGFLVDLGRDGYFGLVHFVVDYGLCCCDLDRTLQMELVTFQVSRRPQPLELAAAASDDDDHFLKCQVVGKELVVENLSDGIFKYFNAFCV